MNSMYSRRVIQEIVELGINLAATRYTMRINVIPSNLAEDARTLCYLRANKHSPHVAVATTYPEHIQETSDYLAACLVIRNSLSDHQGLKPEFMISS